VESSDDAIIGTTLEGIIVIWNKAAEDIFGYAANEVLGHSIAQSIPPDRPNEISTILERLKSGEAMAPYETVQLKRNGERIDLSLTISPIKNAEGRTVGGQIIARDISERKRGRGSAAKARGRIPGCFRFRWHRHWLGRGKRRVATQQSRLAGHAGYTEDELRSLNFRNFTYPQDLERAVSQFKQLMEGKLERFQVEKRYVQKDGNVI
jgi:PAS domain S-box-containing protein